MKQIIDIHAHVYPEKIAIKAAQSIGRFYEIDMALDGTLNTYLSVSDKAGISLSVVHSAAVTWERVANINDFIASCVDAHPGRLIGYGTAHPDHPEAEKEMDRMMILGLKGIKLHPDFQHFNLDDPASVRLFAMMAERDLPAIIHTGDTRYPYSEPERMARVLDAVPSLRVICAHMGGWSRWHDAWKVLAGREQVWVDCSSSLYAMTPEDAVSVMHHYGMDRVLFGVDYPMWYPDIEIGRVEALPLTEEEKEMVYYKNARAFLGLA